METVLYILWQEKNEAKEATSVPLPMFKPIADKGEETVSLDNN